MWESKCNKYYIVFVTYLAKRNCRFWIDYLCASFTYLAPWFCPTHSDKGFSSCWLEWAAKWGEYARHMTCSWHDWVDSEPIWADWHNSPHSVSERLWTLDRSRGSHSSAEFFRASHHIFCLKHTFATRAVEIVFEIESLLELLGHASSTITFDRYVHSTGFMRVVIECQTLRKSIAAGFAWSHQGLYWDTRKVPPF